MTESAVLPETEPVRRSKMLLPIDLLRGFLIGMAELVPGVSGGTVALVTGVYDELIDSASHAISSVKRLVLGPDRLAGFSQEIRRTDWWLVGPVLVGMAAAVLTVAGVMEAFVTGNPEQARGLFFGMVLVSLAVPLLMLPARVKGNRVLDVVIVAVAAVVAFVLTGLAGGGATSEPAAIVVFLAAAVAICALVVPGVSGSFFLLAVGLYTTTLDAVHERDLGYIAVFGAGAIVGLASFVQLLKYLLHHHRRVTLLVMTGLMLGSLRALWPWQSAAESAADDAHGPGALIAPYAPVAGPALLILVGAAVVAVLVWVEFRGKSAE
ncbi:DUF368 domain-containing protein [Nocardioides sp.]|uniref:DUF368 domain-containing protein n=1 Tax=Nocardioides sp. TaxID=35761 RepID=UPI0019B1EBD9|nr:DUF368 domain-containing protein [Nocardioides sp.]MBC7279317.1 DUF368 domain-containing protein [Nocardioides sp.]